VHTLGSRTPTQSLCEALSPCAFLPPKVSLLWSPQSLRPDTRLGPETLVVHSSHQTAIGQIHWLCPGPSVQLVKVLLCSFGVLQQCLGQLRLPALPLLSSNPCSAPDLLDDLGQPMCPLGFLQARAREQWLVSVLRLLGWGLKRRIQELRTAPHLFLLGLS
jgi:hypothetical protein